jgi:FkbM family methyltransferase
MNYDRLAQLAVDTPRALRLLRSVPSLYWVRELVKHKAYHAPPDGGVSDFAFDWRTGNLKLKALQLEYTKEQADLLSDYVGNKARLLDLERVTRTTLARNQRGELIADVDGIKFFVETVGEYNIIWEVFAVKQYAIAVDQPVVVWDLGMNAGVASLYFARDPNVKAVYGYEPFRRTFDAAKYNFSLNPTLAAKIHPVQKAVSDSDGKIDAFYHHELRGGNSIDAKSKRQERDTVEQIELQHADSVFDEIEKSAGGVPIVCKLDTEGAEYRILPTLAKSGRLARLSAITMEYHSGGDLPGVKVLVPLLREAGFSLIHVLHSGAGGGSIFACKAPLQTIFDQHDLR